MQKMHGRWKRFIFSDLLYPLWGYPYLAINKKLKLRGWPFYGTK